MGTYIQRLSESIASVDEHRPSAGRRIKVLCSASLKSRPISGGGNEESSSKSDRREFEGEHRCYGGRAREGET